MKSLAAKGIAILLAAACLLAAIAGALGMFLVAELEMSRQSPTENWLQQLHRDALHVAYAKVRAHQTYQHSTVPQEVLEYAIGQGFADVYEVGLGPDLQAVGWTITDSAGHTDSEGSMLPAENRHSFRFEAIEPSYSLVVPADSPGSGSDSAHTVRFLYGDSAYCVVRTPGEVFSVEVMLEVSDIPFQWDVLFFLYAIRNVLPVMLAGSLLLFGAAMVYLCWAAGKKKGSAEIRPGGLNRLPLDLYGAAVGLAGVGGVYLLFSLISFQENNGFSWMLTCLTVSLALAVCLLPVIYIFAFAAQVKANGFWWRRSVIGFLLLKLVHGLRRCKQGLQALFRLLPVAWQWLLTAAVMGLALCITGYVAFLANSYIRTVPFFVFLFFAVFLGCIGIILYGGYCFGAILKGVKEMADGNLERKIDTGHLVAAFRDCADGINDLSQAAILSAQQQMKSERMKTELIANVSHDIKTPLTAIISYVDLLQQPHSEEENAQYLEVLSRQCQRLKKLTEDLVEVSKATTGNITAELTQVDVCEAVRQALGEFSDKLDAARLTVVLRQPEVPALIRADGRLTWRVLSNLLSNAVKYAQPGTRLYVDVTKTDAQVQISLKNMSREQLNITADELMERFVRGDTARHTEGSGLGLSIAKGLMESQNGSLQLSVDGDLFKVTLLFPAA